MTRLLLTAVATLAVAVPAQTYTISPAYAAAAEGNSLDSTSWEYPSYRLQQIHNDVRGGGFTLSGISFRRDGQLATNSLFVARAIDAELWAGHGNYLAVSTTFASNYVSAPALVVNRKQINLPDLRTNQGAPAPWSIVIPFDQQWSYDGQRDLVWELKIHANSVRSSYVLDAHVGLNMATNRALGVGCIAAGKSQPMTLQSSFASSVDEFSFQWSGANFPNSAPSVVAIDGINANIPGLCTTLYASPLVIVLPGTTSSGGIFIVNPRRIPMNPSWGGVRLYQQAISFDGTQIVLTHGVESVLAAQPDLSRMKQVWAFDPMASAGVVRAWHPSGYVVRFTRP
jgi:hypothetical protein